jgi:DNA-binding GntR family transcriptional regulator
MNGDRTEQRSAVRALWQSHAGTAAAADAAYATLRDAILAGHLRAGDRLGEEQLAREFGVSRTPIREAIFRLEAENFALRLVRRGLVVRPIPEEQVLEVFAVWAALDQLAARLAAEHSTLPDRSRMIWLNERIKNASDRFEQAKLPELNWAFHMALCEAAHNSVLLRMLRQVQYTVLRFGGTTFNVPGRGNAAIAEHSAIIEAIDRGDPETAARLAAEHVDQARHARIAMMRDSVGEVSSFPGNSLGA